MMMDDHIAFGAHGGALPGWSPPRNNRAPALRPSPGFPMAAAAYAVAAMRAIDHLGRMAHLPPTALRLFIVLTNRTSLQTGCCCPGVETLARDLSASPQAVRKACRALEVIGMVHCEANASAHRTNVYRVNLGGFCDGPASCNASRQTLSGQTASRPASCVSPILIGGISGETDVSGSDNTAALLRGAAEAWSNSRA